MKIPWFQGIFAFSGANEADKKSDLLFYTSFCEKVCTLLVQILLGVCILCFGVQTI